MLILASNSPRRKELLRKLGIPFTVIASEADETPVQSSVSTKDLPLEESRLKAYSIAARYPNDEVLACDTIVILNGEVLGKPKNADEAVKMLMKEQGRRQIVLTGYTYISSRREITRSVVSYVYFNPLTLEQVKDYVAKYAPYDKAGGYGIQDEAGLINHIEGSYYNVMGFPLEDIALRVYGRDEKSFS